ACGTSAESARRGTFSGKARAWKEWTADITCSLPAGASPRPRVTPSSPALPNLRRFDGGRDARPSRRYARPVPVPRQRDPEPDGGGPPQPLGTRPVPRPQRGLGAGGGPARADRARVAARAARARRSGGDGVG